METPLVSSTSVLLNPAVQVAEAPNSIPTAITISLPTNAYFLSGIRDFVVNLTKNMTGFSQQWAFRFQAVVDELCNNAIEHGSKPGSIIRVTLISTQISLEVCVEDTGTGPDQMKPEELTHLFKERSQLVAGSYMGFRGRGLPKIVAGWTDEIAFEASDLGGIKAKVKKYLRKEDDTVSSKKKFVLA